MEMRKIVLLTGILLLVSMVELSIAEGPAKKLEGWGGYKFGMTITEAAAVRKEARWEEQLWGSPPVKEKCLAFDSEFMGEKGKVTVRFKEGKLFRITISFDRFKGGCDENLMKTIFGGVVDVYGDKFTIDNREAVWRFPQGGKISLLYVCIRPQDTDFKPEAIGTGVIYLHYEQSEGF
jgi:hypothetical protein